jgi:alkanesulfonate monooxygenase SsuD/methylene tetrahydromethanopterin reductase-like flavin-dependent oxidoreductase (luciferase family)
MLTFSLMTGCILGADQDDVERRRRRVAELTGREPEASSGSTLVGTVDEVRARLAEYEDAGVERVMAQQLLHDDLEQVALLGELARLAAA